MPTCPVCHTPMSVSKVISLPGIENKPVGWHCEEDDVDAVPVHPVQISHLPVGSEEEEGGRRTRVIELEMQGAELLVFRQGVREHSRIDG